MKELFLSAEEQALINVTELCLISSGVSDERRRCTGELLQHCLYLAAKEWADLGVLIPAVLLKECSPSMRKNFLEGLEMYSEEKIQEIENIISYSIDTVESAILHAAVSMQELVAA